MICFFLKKKSDHNSLVKILQWFHCLQRNFHIFQHNLKVLHWSVTNLPAPFFPIISQIYSPLLKYIAPLYISSRCSLGMEHLTLLFLFFFQALLLQNLSFSLRREINVLFSSSKTQIYNIHSAITMTFIFPFARLLYPYLLKIKFQAYLGKGLHLSITRLSTGLKPSGPSIDIYWKQNEVEHTHQNIKKDRLCK